MGITLLEHRKDGDGFFGSLVPSCGPVTSPAQRAVSKMSNGSIHLHSEKDLPVAPTQPGEDGLSGKVPAAIDWCQRRAISLSALHKFHFQHHCDDFCRR
jgi:hypothetical protein